MRVRPTQQPAEEAKDVLPPNSLPMGVDAHVQNRPTDAAKREASDHIAVQDDFHDIDRNTSSSEVKPAAFASNSDSRQRS